MTLFSPFSGDTIAAAAGLDAGGQIRTVRCRICPSPCWIYASLIGMRPPCLPLTAPAPSASWPPWPSPLVCGVQPNVAAVDLDTLYIDLPGRFCASMGF